MYIRNAVIHLSNIKKFNTVANIGKKYEEKFKGTIVEKWIRYWKNLYTDYKEVVIDLRKDAKEKPIKAIGILSTFAFLGFCAKTNPDDISFRDAVLKASNEILLVSPTQRRPDAVEHLRLLEKCYNANIIRRFSLGVVSVIWVDNYSDMCNTYECTCSYLELSYIDFFKRIIDIGFINKWWLLEKHMEDFDVND